MEYREQLKKIIGEEAYAAIGGEDVLKMRGHEADLFIAIAKLLEHYRNKDKE